MDFSWPAYLISHRHLQHFLLSFVTFLSRFSIILCHLSHFFPPGFYFSYPSFISYFLRFCALMSYVLFLTFHTSVSHFLFLVIFSHVCISHFPESCLLTPTFSRYLPHYILSFTFLLLISVFLFLISRISTYYLPHFYLLSSTSLRLLYFFLISHIFISYFLLISRISASQLIYLYILSSKFLSQTSHFSVSYLPHFYISSPRFPFLNSHISLPLLPHRYLISISHLSFAYLLRLPRDSLSSPVPISSLPPLLILLPLLLLPLPPFYSKFF